MEVKIILKKYRMLDDLKNLIEKKTVKLEKYFNDDAQAKYTLTKIDEVYKMELAITTKSVTFIAESKGRNMYENLDIVLPKVERQILKNRDKLKDKIKKVNLDTLALEFENQAYKEIMKKERVPKVVKRKQYFLTAITQKEAELEFGLTDHSFYIYLSKETGRVCILYKRDDGDLGIVEAVV